MIITCIYAYTWLCHVLHWWFSTFSMKTSNIITGNFYVYIAWAYVVANASDRVHFP